MTPKRKLRILKVLEVVLHCSSGLLMMMVIAMAMVMEMMMMTVNDDGYVI